MYAIIRAGGKQYKVSAGDTVRVELLEKNLGDIFDLNEVLMVGGDKTFVGAPLVQNAKVTVVVTRQGRAAKVIVFKKKRRQGYRRMQGHRQFFTELFVKSITTPEGQTVAADRVAIVIDPAKIAARKAAASEKQVKTKSAKAAAVEAATTVKKVAKKKVVKKVAKKAATKKVVKKAAPKKKTATKKAAAKSK
jgi:large subunit ribosomal protein L21